jgi:pimeloyl-ACP methyl ester carboxylesterase
MRRRRFPEKTTKSAIACALPALLYAGMKAAARLDRRRPDPERGRSFADSRGRPLRAVTRDGRTVHADVRGSGDAALVCAHGWCCSGDFFHYQRELAEKVPGLRVVTVDLRGHGSSPAEPGLEYSVEKYAEDLRAVVEELGVSRFVLMGHSMGGFASFAFCRLFGEEYRGRLAGVVSLNSTGIHLFHGVPGGVRLRGLLRSPRFYRLLERLAARHRLLERLLGLLSRSDLVYLLYRFIGFGPRPSPQMLDNIISMTLGGPVPTMLLDARACLEYSCEEALPGIEVPVLLVAGSKDYLVSKATNLETCSRLRRAALRVFRSGHGCPLDRHEEVNQAVADFLLEVLGEGSAGKQAVV